MKKMNLLGWSMVAIFGSSSTPASTDTDQLEINSPRKAVAYDRHMHAGLLIDGDIPLNPQAAQIFESRVPRPQFEEDRLPPFLSKREVMGGCAVDVENPWWRHAQDGRNWYVIANHKMSFVVDAQTPVRTTFVRAICHRTFSDRVSYGYEVRVSFGSDPKATGTYSLYEPLMGTTP
ncbi:MAG: hypothetical protein LCH26_03230 [Proteobacteria bacterium]|nr:hypothetical protein [Pseudomonadota bacterium]